MARAVKFAKTIRNNWKKSVFFTGVAAYGANYLKQKYDDSLLRSAYCLEAKRYGDIPIRTGDRARKVTVFLNPAVRNGKGKKLYEKNVAPVLNMAGIEVTVVRTEYEGQAKRYMGVLDPSDAVVVAGGDGTLSEVITGLLRRDDQDQFTRIPIGVIPLGYTNTMSRVLVPDGLSDVGRMLEASLAVVRGITRPTDVMCIQGEGDRTVYTTTGMEWGAYRDAEERKKKYWYFGGLKHRFTYLRASLKQWPPLIKASLSYVLPCEGCSKCFVPPPQPTWKWWHFFAPPRREVVKKDYSDVVNEECGAEHTEEFSTLEFTANTCNCSQPNLEKEQRAIDINIAPDNVTKTDFIKEGWRRIKDKSLNVQNYKTIRAKEFTLHPELQNGEEAWFSIDQEQFEAMPVKIQLLPHKLQFFFSESISSLPQNKQS